MTGSVPAQEGARLSHDHIAQALNKWANYIAFKETEQSYVMLRLPHKTVALFAGNRAGKCLTADTKIYLADGSQERIANIKAGDTVLSLDENLKITESRVNSLIDSGVKDVVRIETRSGKVLKTTAEHPYYTVSGWKEVSGLQVGEHIAVPRRLPDPLLSATAQRWVYIILGYLIGDGGISGGTIKFTTVDENIIKEIKTILPCCLNLNRECSNSINYRIAKRKEDKKNILATILKNEGLMGTTSHTKFVPQFILRSEKKNIALFLSRLFSCDGWVDDRGIGYCSVSRELIEGVRDLLLRFGITARIREKQVKYKDTRRTAFEIGIKRIEHLKAFSKEIGIYSKQKKLDALLKEKSAVTPKDSYDVVPISIRELYGDIPKIKYAGRGGRNGEKYADTGKYDLLRTARGKTVSRDKLFEIGTEFRRGDLVRLSQSDIYWDEIVSVEQCGTDQMYDLEIEGTHNFIANCVFAHNTATIAYHYIARMLGHHKVAAKNALMKKVRCISSSLPESDDPSVQDNAQYTELKRLIPPELILKDITARSANLVVRRPVGLSSDRTVFEFRSSKQELQDLGKINISSLWHDEETPKDKREECKMRLISEGGDEVFSLTATNPISYMFDEVWRQAAYIFRTKTISQKFGLPQVEKIKTGRDIAAIQMATDDNPTLDLDIIDHIFQDISDPDELALRRYGVFKQISGRIFKSYDPSICYIPFKKYFPNGIPYEWVHARGIDYHESRTPWSIGWVSANQNDEWFLWQEFHPAIDGPNAYNTYDISKAVVRKSGDYYFTVNLIDPLASKKQPNTLFSVTDDLNRHFLQLREVEGMGTPAYWEGWNTKGTGGRDEVAKRFKNAVRCGKPFNNAIKEKGAVKYLPTLWICDTCPNFHKSVLNWSYGEWVTQGTKAVNDPKPTPQQKNSHDNMVLEAFSKDSRLLHASHFMRNRPPVQQHRKHSVTGR